MYLCSEWRSTKTFCIYFCHSARMSMHVKLTTSTATTKGTPKKKLPNFIATGNNTIQVNTMQLVCITKKYWQYKLILHYYTLPLVTMHTTVQYPPVHTVHNHAFPSRNSALLSNTLHSHYIPSKTSTLLSNTLHSPDDIPSRTGALLKNTLHSVV